MSDVSFEQINTEVARLVFSAEATTQWDNVRFTLERDANDNIVGLTMIKVG
jgi:hypothetical protein